MLAATQNDLIKELSRKNGWQEIGFFEFLKMRGFDAKGASRIMAHHEGQGWTAFLKEAI